VISEKN